MGIIKQKAKFFAITCMSLFMMTNFVFASEDRVDHIASEQARDAWINKRLKQLEGRSFKNSGFNADRYCHYKRDLIFGNFTDGVISATYKFRCGEKLWSNAIIEVKPNRIHWTDTNNYSGYLNYEMLFLSGYNGEEDVKDQIEEGTVGFLPAGRIEIDGNIYEPTN